MSDHQSEFVRTLLAERGTLLGFIHSLVRDRHLAEDVFQSVMVAAISKRDEIQDREHLLKWLRTAARFEPPGGALGAARQLSRVGEGGCAAAVRGAADAQRARPAPPAVRGIQTG